MLCRTDDELATVDSDFLGPSGLTLLWRARYSAYGVGIGLAVLAYAVEHKAGVQFTATTVLVTGVLVILATRRIGLAVTFETPLRALAATFVHEVSGPRRPPPLHGTVRPCAVTIVRPKPPKPKRTALHVVGNDEPDESAVDRLPNLTAAGARCSQWCAVGLHESCNYEGCACTRCHGDH